MPPPSAPNITELVNDDSHPASARMPFAGVLLCKEQFDQDQQLQLRYWFASERGTVCLHIRGEQALCFVPTAQLAQCQARLTHLKLKFRSQSLALRTFNQTPVSALYFYSQRDYYQARQRLKSEGITLYEDDIRHCDRFLMERFLYGGALLNPEQLQSDNGPNNTPAHYQLFTLDSRLPTATPKASKPLAVASTLPHQSLKWLSFDIECSEQGELYSIAWHSQTSNWVMVVDADGQSQPESLATHPLLTGSVLIQYCQTEAELISAFLVSVNHADPDIIAGWNSDNFDWPLLSRRAAVHNLDVTLGRDGSALTIRALSNGQNAVTIVGRVALDGINALKSASYQFQSYSLENIAQHFLGTGKSVQAHQKMAQINALFANNKPELAIYNLLDCQLVARIFAHTQMLEYLVLRGSLTGLELDRPGGSVAAFCNRYLPKMHRLGYVAPNLGDSPLTQASPGGYVMSSKPGLYQNVLVLDYKSLYPSIIRSFLVDPVGLINGLADPPNSVPGFIGAQFHRQQHLLPSFIAELWQARDVAKAQGDQQRSHAIKIIMNSFYGVLGSTGCRFFDPRLASSITLRGHQIMQQTRKLIEQQGFNVIYGDTDSTFVDIGDAESARATQIGQALALMVNDYWRDHLTSHYQLTSALEIQFETHYAPFFMPTIRGSDEGSKKRYVGQKQGKNGAELVFKGLETVRSDWTELAKRLQTQLVQQLFSQGDTEQYLKQVIAQLLAGEIDQQLVYSKKLRKPTSAYVRTTPPHVKAARKLQSAGFNAHRGDIIEYLITDQGPEPIQTFVAEQCAIDYQHYLQKQILPIAQMFNLALPAIARADAPQQGQLF